MKQNNEEIKKYIICHPILGMGKGNNGAFMIPYQSMELTVITSVGQGWEHVSVSLKNRIPNYFEMCFVKDLFFDENETVVQFHVPKEKHVNNMKNCLHLWRDQRNGHLLPPSIMV